MCISTPMQVIEIPAPGQALCERNGQRETVSTLLIDDPVPGQWLLVHLGWARDIIDAETARRTEMALVAVETVMAGGDAGALIAALGELPSQEDGAEEPA